MLSLGKSQLNLVLDGFKACAFGEYQKQRAIRVTGSDDGAPDDAALRFQRGVRQSRRHGGKMCPTMFHYLTGMSHFEYRAEFDLRLRFRIQNIL